MQKNILKRGKKALICVSVVLLLVSIGLLAGGIILAIQGFGAIGSDASVAIIVVKCVFGVVMGLLGIWGLCSAVVMLWTGAAMKTALGNMLEEAIPKGTLNMTKCQNCGSEVKEGEEFCGKCGKSLSETVVCKECGTENEADQKFCKSCGKPL